MTLRPALLAAPLALLPVFSRAAEAPVLRDRYTVRAGGVERAYALALDEAGATDAAGARRKVALRARTAPEAGEAIRAERARAGGEVQPVFYEEGKPRTLYTRALATRRLLLQAGEGADVAALAAEHGLRVLPATAGAPGLVVLEAETPERALAAMELLRGRAGVAAADVLLARQRQKKLVPSDPLFAQQWHLRNAGQSGGAWWIDLRATEAWDQATGAGVTIGIVDDGVQYTHPDLQANYNLTLDYDFNGGDSDPAPVDLANDSHGTSCAGVAAARGSNGLGVSGVAPAATLTGLRLIAAPVSDQDEADAFAHNNNLIHIKSNSWGTPDGTGSVDGPGPLAKAALKNGVLNGRGGLGTVYLFASGNGLDGQDNSNYDGYANAIEVIAVGAVNDHGFQSYYSEPGANIAVVAPSDGGGHNEGIVTTDLTGEGGENKVSVGTGDLSDRSYTRLFGGTSSACPAVAGVVALMLQANPGLGWRDVKEILMLTARPVHTADPDWAVNGAGIPFNHKYGAGLVDAAAAVEVARNWRNLGPVSVLPRSNTSSTAIPDASATGVTKTMVFTEQNFRVEQVEVLVNLTHTSRGDLEVILTSPSGMQSRLAEHHQDSGDNYASWTFTSVRHWGETAAGNWTVKVADREPGDTGTFGSLTVRLHGVNQASARPAGASAALVAEADLPANGVADPGEDVTFSIGLRNLGTVATTGLTATLLPVAGVAAPGPAQSFGALAAGGAAVSRPFTFRAEGSTGTRVKAVLHLTDGVADLGHAAVSIPLGATSTAQSSQGGTINLRDNSTALPSPATVTVSGIAGRVHGVSAALTGFTHGFPDDVGLLLQGPDSLQMVLFSGGTQTAFSSRAITFSDAAGVYLPGSGAVANGTYRPNDLYGVGRVFTQDPGTENAFTLGEFNGLNANGTWRLFAEDFGAGEFGSIASWRLAFTAVAAVDNAGFTVSASAVDEAAGAALVTVRRGGGREGTASVAYSTSNLSAQSGLDFTSTSGTLSFAVGELEKTISVTLLNDNTLEADESFLLTLSTPGGNTTLGGRVTHTVTVRDGDRDGDGLPDDYETTHGLNPDLNSDAALDGDGDHYTNLEEYELGTLPGDAASALILRGERSGMGTTITFPSVVGRVYTVERSAVIGPPWTVLAQDLAGTGAQLRHVDNDPSAPAPGFYRVTGRKAAAP